MKSKRELPESFLTVGEFAEILFESQNSVREDGGLPSLSWDDIPAESRKTYLCRATYILSKCRVTKLPDDMLN